MEDSLDETSLRYPGRDRRCWDASSAASLRDIADAFLRAVLKENLDFGTKTARISISFSFRAFMA